MILLQAVGVGKSFGAQLVLDEVSLMVQTGDRLGVVGVNGIGKSTLLKVLLGELAPDQGTVIRAKNLAVAYLAQSNSAFDSPRSVRQEMLAAFAPLLEMETQLREMEARMGDPALLAEENKHRQLLLDYDALAATFASKGGFTYEADLRGVLRGLNFSEAEEDTPVAQLSGGQKTRLNLARCLLGAPDLLILDEPTNYLDMDNLAWLERYLQEYRGAVLAVSHDRYFLDAVAHTIYEVERRRVARYTGNYTSFVSQKAALLEQRLKAYKKQQEDIARMEDFVRRNMAAKDTTKRAQSRLKTLEKMERLERPAQTRRVHVSFGVKREANLEALQLHDLAIGYAGVALSQNISFTLGNRERVALIGPNGVGKSTLLKTIAGQLRPLAGRISAGVLVQMGYYDQEYQGLNPEKEVLNELWDRFPQLDELTIRKALGGFLFSGDEVEKKVAVLSGGEKARLSLAILMLRQANLLLLDEPTNHLDLPGKEALEDALADYPGAILFVSHDRYFINKVATRTIYLSAAGLASYQGNYDYYLEKKTQQAVLPPAADPKAAEKQTSQEKVQYLQKKEEERQKRKRQKEIATLEKTIAALEERLTQLSQELEQPEINQDYQACQQRQQEMDQARAQLEESLEKWLTLLEEA